MVTITLPPELEKVVTQQANQRGTTPELLALDDLQRIYLNPQDDTQADEQTLADYWADYIGSVDSRENNVHRSDWSENTGQKFTELMIEKHRKGKL